MFLLNVLTIKDDVSDCLQEKIHNAYSDRVWM